MNLSAKRRKVSPEEDFFVPIYSDEDDDDTVIVETYPRRRTKSVVVGMGPAGLASALTLLQKGHDVTLIDKRSDYTLRQKVIIPMPLIEMLLTYGIQTELLQQLKFKKGLISISKFNHLYYTIFNTFYNRGYGVIEHGVNTNIIGNLQILRGSEYEVTGINVPHQLIHLKNQNIISFDHIIDATGNGAHIMALISPESDLYEPLQLQPEHSYHALVKFHSNVPPRSAMIDCFSESKFYKKEQFKENGWTNERPPNFYLYAKPSPSQNVYLLSEIPDKLMQESDPAGMMDFFGRILEQERVLNAQQVIEQTPNVMLFSKFNVEHKKLINPCYILGSGGVAIAVGDANFPANFNFGHGIEKGITDGQHLQHVFLNDGGLDLNALSVRNNSIINEYYMKDTEFKLIQSKRRFINSSM